MALAAKVEGKEYMEIILANVRVKQRRVLRDMCSSTFENRSKMYIKQIRIVSPPPCSKDLACYRASLATGGGPHS
jgi:hypothetical protein